jgi:DNA-binding Xre family transcriptional regulator
LIWYVGRGVESGDKLFKLLIDKGMVKGDLCRLSGVSKASVAELKLVKV